MRIKKNILQYNTFIIFLSILFIMVASTLAKRSIKLKTGGQLLKSVQPDFVFNNFDNKDIDLIHVSANTNILPEKKPEVVKSVGQKSVQGDLPPKDLVKDDSKKEVKDTGAKSVAEKKEVNVSEKKPEPLKEENKEVAVAEKQAVDKELELKKEQISVQEDKDAAKKKVKIIEKPFVQVKKESKKDNIIDKEEKIVFNFEDVDLANVADYVEKLFNVKFITDEMIQPSPKGAKGLSGHKISFKTQKALTKKQAWNLFLAFLNMVNLTIVPQGPAQEGQVRVYRIRIIQASQSQSDAKSSPIPSFIGVDPDTLPDSDQLIRYGYFVKDCPLDTIRTVIESLKSTFADLLILRDHNAFILTDSSYNIKVLMKIVKELDRVTMPQSMSVLRLYKTDAIEVQKVYKALVADTQGSGPVAARIFGQRKPSRALYFPKNTKMIIEPRTNSLVLLGTDEGIKKVEAFVKKYLDIDVTAPYSPLNIYELKYANASDIAAIMKNLVQFGGGNQQGGLRGGVRSGDKYFKNMSFTPEKEGNRLIIRGDYDDYLKVKEIIAELDEAPTQVAIEILLLGVEVQNKKELGAQIRSKFKSPDGQKINFQTSGIRLGSSAKPIVLNKDESVGNLRLLGDLVNLVSGAVAGSTVVSLGSDKYGLWGIFGMLDQMTNTQILSNPFLTATNNTKAKVELGETRRIVTAEVKNTDNSNAFGDYNASIIVEVTPKVNSDGMIVMDINIGFDSFLSDLSKSIRKITTSVILSNNEILALGGLLKDQDTDAYSKTPILGNIPLLGWLFKNKSKTKRKEDLLVLVTASIIKPEEKVTDFTKRHLKEYKNTLDEYSVVKNKKDPIDRAFFPEVKSEYDLDNYIFTRGKDRPFGINKNVKNANKEMKNKKRRRRLKREVKTPGQLDKQVKKKMSRKERRKKRRKISSDLKNDRSGTGQKV